MVRVSRGPNGGAIGAADFFTVELLTLRGLSQRHVFFAIDLKSRRIEIAGIGAEPREPWMENIIRSLTDAFDGFLLGIKYLILDRDPVFAKDIRQMLREEGVKVVRLPARSPNLNAFAERFVGSVRREPVTAACASAVVLEAAVARELPIPGSIGVAAGNAEALAVQMDEMGATLRHTGLARHIVKFGGPSVVSLHTQTQVVQHRQLVASPRVVGLTRTRVVARASTRVERIRASPDQQITHGDAHPGVTLTVFEQVRRQGDGGVLGGRDLAERSLRVDVQTHEVLDRTPGSSGDLSTAPIDDRDAASGCGEFDVDIALGPALSKDALTFGPSLGLILPARVELPPQLALRSP